MDGLARKPGRSAAVKNVERGEAQPASTFRRKTSKKWQAHYSKPSESLARLGRALHDLPASGSKFEVVKLSLNEWLDFFEQEKQKLDLVWGEWPSAPKPALKSEWTQLNEDSSHLSLELSKLHAQALERSVELDLMTSDTHSLEGEGMGLGGMDALASSKASSQHLLARYHHLLETILERSNRYHEITQKASEVSGNSAQVKGDNFTCNER